MPFACVGETWSIARLISGALLPADLIALASGLFESFSARRKPFVVTMANATVTPKKRFIETPLN